MAQKILIIEDDKFLAQLLKKKLEEEKLEVVIAPNGEIGLKNAPETNLIILDLLLPEMDGFEVLKKLKENENTKKIPVLILSNLGQREEIKQGLELGAVDYLVKANFTPREIIEKIKLLLKS
ncbi:MAG: response regulator transcription factor [Minisyncoccales bacterium]